MRHVRRGAAVVLVGLGVAACEPSPSEAIRGIEKRGYDFSLDGFAQAMDDDDMSVILRFLIADTDDRMRNHVLLVRAACADRPSSRAEECLDQIKFLKGRGADLTAADSQGDNVLWYAVQSAQLEIVDWLLKQDIPVTDETVVQRAEQLAAQEYNVTTRVRREAISLEVQARYNLGVVLRARDEVQNQVDRGLVRDVPSVGDQGNPFN